MMFDKIFFNKNNYGCSCAYYFSGLLYVCVDLFGFWVFQIFGQGVLFFPSTGCVMLCCVLGVGLCCVLCCVLCVVLGVGCWVLGVGCRVLRCWVVLGCVVYCVLCWVLGVGCRVLRCWVVLGCVVCCVLCWVLGVGCWVSGVAVLGCVGLCCVLCVVLDCVLLGRLKEEIKTPPLVFHTRINATQLRWITMPRSPPPPSPDCNVEKRFAIPLAVTLPANIAIGGAGGRGGRSLHSDFQILPKSRLSHIKISRNPEFQKSCLPEIQIFQKSTFSEIQILRDLDFKKSWI